MYHQFINQNSLYSSSLNKKLTQVLNYYSNIESQQAQQLQLFLSGQEKLLKNYPVNINYSLQNKKHNCILFSLSNDKLIRYDFSQDVMHELSTGIDLDISNIKVLDIGSTEKYVIINSNHIIFCSLIKPNSSSLASYHDDRDIKIQTQSPDSLYQEMQDQSYSEINQIQPLDYQEMQDQSERQLASTNKPFKIDTIQCQLFKQSLQEIISQNQIKQPVNQESKLKPKRRLRSVGLQIIEKSCNLNLSNHKSQKNQLQQQKLDKTFVLVSLTFAVLYELTLVKQEEHIIQEQVISQKQDNPFSKTFKCDNSESVKICQIQFPNKKHFAQLALSSIQIPFSSQKQDQTINPIQVTNQNNKFTKTSPMLKCDRHHVALSSELSCFSIYFVTQTINHDMEAAEKRHFVFEFRFGISTQDSKLVTSQHWGSPFYDYPDRTVMCPAKVYGFPLLANTGILCYVNVSKTLSQFQSEKSIWQPSCYRFTTVTMLQDCKMQFGQIQCKLSSKQDQKQLNHHYRHLLNEQDKKWKILFEQKLILLQIMLIDLAQEYAIMAVGTNKIKLRPDLIPNNTYFSYNKNELQQQKIVVVNLKQKLPPNQSRISAQYILSLFDDQLPNIQLNTESQNKDFFLRQQVVIQTDPKVLQNSLHLPKKLNLIEGNLKKQQKQLKKGQPIYKDIQLIPKAMIYCQMINWLAEKMFQQKQINAENQGPEKKTFLNKQNISEVDSFYGHVLEMLDQ